MDSIQVGNILGFIEQRFSVDAPSARKQLAAYIGENLEAIAVALATRGEVSIPTQNGFIKLTTKDLQAAA